MSRALTKIRPSIKKLSSRHHAILDCKLKHPEWTQRQIAAALNYTEAWVSIVVNSNSFQAMYREKYGEQFDQVVVPVRDRVTGVAVQALERVGEALQDGTHTPKFALDTSNVMLKALGFVGSGAVQGENVQINHYHGVDPSLLRESRERIRSREGHEPHELCEGGGHSVEGPLAPENASPSEPSDVTDSDA